jgi:hypothetical protein
MGRKRKDDGGEEKDPKVEAQEQAEKEAAEPQARQGPQEPEGGPAGESEAGGGPSSPSPQGGPQGDEDFGAEAEAQTPPINAERPPGFERAEFEGKPVDGDASLQSQMAPLSAEQRRMVVQFVEAIRDPGRAEALRAALEGPQDRPPVMSQAEIIEAQNRESEAVRASGGGQVPDHRGMTSGETDPRLIPTLRQPEGDPRKAREDYRSAEGEQPEGTEDRPLNEGEVAANLAVLRAKGDTAYQHPSYAAEARERAMVPRGDSGQKFYRILGNHQVGAVAGPDRGGAQRAYTVTELGITESQVPRLLQKGVIVLDPQD